MQAIVLESRIEAVDQAEAAALRAAESAGFAENDQHSIAMAVREITVNAVLHGNQLQPDKRVRLEFDSQPGELVISILDQGRGFQPGEIPDPLSPENIMRQSGRGIFLARAFMDSVELQPSPNGTRVVLRKHLPPGAERKRG